MIELSEETEALARSVAEARRVTVDAAVRQALEACAFAACVTREAGHERDESSEAIAIRRERVAQFVREIAAMPVLDQRTPRAIMDDINAL